MERVSNCTNAIGLTFHVLIIVNRSAPTHCWQPHEETELHESRRMQSAWIPLANTWGAVWEGSQLPQFPADIQLTNADNQSVIARYALVCFHCPPGMTL